MEPVDIKGRDKLYSAKFLDSTSSEKINSSQANTTEKVQKIRIEIEVTDDVPTQPLSPDRVSKDSLQESVKENKTRERRLVFDTLKKKSKKTIDSYGNKQDLENRFKKEIIRFNPSLRLSNHQNESLLEELVSSLDLPENAKDIDRALLKEKLENYDINASSVIVDRVCFVEKEAISTSDETRIKIDQNSRLRSDLDNIDTFKNKLFHSIMNQRAKSGYKIDKTNIQELRQQIEQLNIGDNPNELPENELTDMLLKNEITSKNIAKETCKEYKAALKNREKNIEELSKTTQKLNALLRSDPKDEDLQKVNKELISLLRQAFNTKAYQALKECEDNPTIHYLHEINLAMYTEVKLLDAYISPSEDEKYLGDKLVEDHENKTLPDAIKEVREDAVKKRGLFSSHNCMKYIIKHFRQYWGAFTSQMFGSPFGTYDPHGDLGNNVGAIYEENLDVNGKKGRALDVRTPSPTIGNNVSHEFRAALQSIQNQRMAEYENEGGYGRPNCWIFTNYQDMTDAVSGEYQRSKVIMHLNDEYPLAFSGITLSKDSAYFKDGIGHGDSLWKEIDTKTPFNSDSIEGYVQKMKEKLKDDAHFTLKNRTKNKGNKLYFPTKNAMDKDEYKIMLDTVAEETGNLLKDIVGQKEYKGQDAWMIKAAGREFAYAAIQKYVQAKELANLQAQGINPSIITTSACKEDIDRGFSDHIKRMYMLEAGDEILLSKIVNLPALMARYRVILEDRVQPLIGVTTYIKREDAKQGLNTLTKGLSVRSESATQLITRK